MQATIGCRSNWQKPSSRPRRAASSRRKADEKRYAALNEEKWVSDANYEQKKATADEARGRVERATRALALAKNQLAYADLVATEGGVITALPVEVGQVVSAGQLIARVARLDELEAVVSIPESRIDADRNAAATVTLWADADRVYAAKLREISPQADPATRTYQARYSLMKPVPPSRSARRRRCIWRRRAPASAPSSLSRPCSGIKASRPYGSSMKRMGA